MKAVFSCIIFLTLTLISGCSSIINSTGANEGKRINDDWMEYKVFHPGLDITLLHPYSSELMPISTIGKSSPPPLRHRIKYGTQSNPHELLLIGSNTKEVYFDGKYYGSIWRAELVIKDGVVMINGVLAVEKPLPVQN